MPHSFLQLPDSSQKTDSYTALRGRFEAAPGRRYYLKCAGASWFQIWLNGEWLAEGPARFLEGKPEYETRELPVKPGSNVLAVALNYLGIETRMMKKMTAFLMAGVTSDDGSQADVSWKAHALEGYRPALRRVNPQLGWCEWCDTRLNPAGWQTPAFNDGAWPAISSDERDQAMAEVPLGPIGQTAVELSPLAEGKWTEMFGYELDDPTWRFLLRDLSPRDLPPQGVWRRYDLGRVRLAKARIVLDVPAGSVVELGYSEWLHEGRVAPFINFSTGTSCNLDHYVARGGVQEFGPLTPRGGRYLEVHVRANPADVRWLSAQAQDRGYHGEPQGAFRCEDALLNRIWSVGVETYRACAEDALTDNPTRERGQWTGDVVSVGLSIATVAYGDLRLLRRGLVQSAQSAKATGLVAGLCPGGDEYLASYAAQWTTACVEYYQATGDLSLLSDCFPHAIRNLEAFEPFFTEKGLREGMDWPFIDWGYFKSPDEIDLAFNIHLLNAYRSFQRWGKYLRTTDHSEKVTLREGQLSHALKTHITEKLGEGFAGIGYHGTVLGLAADLVPGERRREGVEFIKAHILRCHPNNPDAPRLSDPSANNAQLITPYFSHYAFKALIEEGEMPFVLGQYRKCWGWMLEQQSGTWLEVFDVRWSHCHQWAGCPTWQLSQFGLGLRPRRDLAANAYEFCFHPGDLMEAEGKVPLAGTSGVIHIQWKRKGSEIDYQLSPPQPILVKNLPGDEKEILVESLRKFRWKISEDGKISIL